MEAASCTSMIQQNFPPTDKLVVVYGLWDSFEQV